MLIGPERLMRSFLSDEEAEVVYRDNPELGESPLRVLPDVPEARHLPLPGR
jgi:hypothetical protein